ncbi:ABC-type transport auxiliary lipoprotein family protein [Glaciimonas sp. PAMC28666]|uniref:ABC-type transport auxiliary lipoprotein family protein n=1 Tax=Glaciimonas sp. PAMC28666 TaxID=2807626 RepID=UPI001965DE2D|nr:ABC-type transport auxiliary lipoprotein family protein [Glaciimonas sp. PAMC28666]QRX84101.1 membrane integrity-associated transporter subunit PqiC [Glaciimonas sp. PAMC28666]
MTKFNALLKAVLIMSILVVTGGCATSSAVRTQYDFGPLPSAISNPRSGARALPAVSLAEVVAPAGLDNTMMLYRLAYANDLQLRPYANSRWTMSPSQLFSQRLKARFGQAGGTVVSVSDGAINIPVLRIEMDDFSQTFDSASHSVVQITLRAAIFNGRLLQGQKMFSRSAVAQTADAAGGARAFSTASDALIDDLMDWLAGLSPNKSRQ